MKKQIMLKTALVAGLLLPFAASALTIDEFDTDQGPLIVAPTGPNANSSSVSGGGIVGFERDLHISIPSGLSPLPSSATVGFGRFLLQNDSQSTSIVTMQWDGADNSTALDQNGLGGIDLTEGNATDAFDIRFLFNDLPGSLQLTVWSGSDSSTITWPTPALLLTTDLSLFIPFSAFTTNTGAGADFTNVGAIEMTMSGFTNGTDIEIDYIRTTLAPVPVPAAVWLFGSALMGLGLRRRNS